MQKSLHIFLVFGLLAISQLAAAQGKTGKIAGKILNKSSAVSEELIGATVQIEGTSTGAATDIEGKFLFDVAAGDYTLVVSYVSYLTQKLKVSVKPGEVTFVDIALEEEKTSLKEVVVTYKVEKSSALSLLMVRKNSAVISDGISADLIRKTPDRTASDVLKRVTGASIQEGKFAIIRGMNDRYNAGYLDNALLPSTEADRKAFAFDVVPASLIDNIQIIKAGSADLSGDFGGGVIKINTKSVPEQFSQTISLGGQVISNTAFRNFSEFASYSGENIGMLSSKRELPNLPAGGLKTVNNFPTLTEVQRLATNSQLFTNDWSNRVMQAPINPRFSYALGFPVLLGGDRKLGMIFALNYADTRRTIAGEVNSFDGGGQVTAFKDDIYQRNTTGGAILNVNYVAGKTQLSFRNLYNVNFDRNTVLRTGSGNISDGLEVDNIANIANHNQLINSVLSLKQIVGNNFCTLQAAFNYSNVRRRTPDYRIASYTKTTDDETYKLALGDFFNTSTGRFFSDLKEELLGGTFDLNKQLKDVLKTNVKVGAFYQHRNRSFFGRSFVYGGTPPAVQTLNPQDDLFASNIKDGKLYLVEKTSDDIGYYKGTSALVAFYAAADQQFFEKLKASYGVRYEMANIKVDNEKAKLDIADIQQSVFLPSVNLTYNLTEKTNLRAAYFASVNRPEFRELAPFAFYVFDKNAEIKGNKDLKIANLNNFDVRYEFFPSGNQLLSIGGFYKIIKNPIEYSIDVTQPFTTFTYQNEKTARIYGIELEARKNLTFLGKAAFWQDLTVFGNLSLIQSKLQFKAGTQAKQNRPLQGQSPFIVNGGIQYESPENGWSLSTMVNRVGRRIAFVGVDAKFGDTRQDIYEAPRTVLDVQIGKTIKKFNIKLTLADILRQRQNFYQDADGDGKYKTASPDRLMFSYLTGFQSSLTIGYTF